mmetsp:Transcript_53450/g.155843  ORF Transcript_53450/g.155843 Transcript_53450/m.155843 type:complete len:227 (+) Transcript_53450:84-764(+)
MNLARKVSSGGASLSGVLHRRPSCGLWACSSSLVGWAASSGSSTAMRRWCGRSVSIRVQGTKGLAHFWRRSSITSRPTTSVASSCCLQSLASASPWASAACAAVVDAAGHGRIHAAGTATQSARSAAPLTSTPANCTGGPAAARTAPAAAPPAARAARPSAGRAKPARSAWAAWAASAAARTSWACSSAWWSWWWASSLSSASSPPSWRSSRPSRRPGRSSRESSR